MRPAVFVKREAQLSEVGQALWERLQPLRHGDYGGSASLTTDEAHAVIGAGEFTDPRVRLDPDESALIGRLRALLVEADLTAAGGAGMDEDREPPRRRRTLLDFAHCG